MKQVLILSAHKASLDRRIASQANQLAKSGFAVTLVSVPCPDARSVLDQAVRLEMAESAASPGCKGRRLKDRFLAMPLLGPAAQWVWWSLGRGPAGGLADYFLQHAPAEKWDVIHCHDLETLPAGIAVRDAISPSARLIYDSHELFPDTMETFWQRRYWRRVEKEIIHRPDCVITVNQSIAEELARTYEITVPETIFNSHGLATAGPAITDEEFARYFNAPIECGDKVICQGSMRRQDNLASLVRAFKQFGGQASLFLLGDGAAVPELKKLAEAEGISNVYFGRAVEQSQLLRFVAHAELGIIPYIATTRNYRFCTPNKLFEFIEALVPVCASDLPELRRIVMENRIGQVYGMASPAAIAAAVADCLKRRKAGEFNDGLLSAARQKYCWPRQAEKLLEIYRRLGV